MEILERNFLTTDKYMFRECTNPRLPPSNRLPQHNKSTQPLGLPLPIGGL